MNTCYQINLMQGYGGGEVYTRFFTRALLQLSWNPVVYVHPSGPLRQRLQEDGVTTIAAESFADIVPQLPRQPSVIISHTPALGPLCVAVENHFWASFAHMPLAGRDPQPFRQPDLVMGVSRYVIQTLHDAGIQAVWPDPMYGIADLVPRGTSGDGRIIRHSDYDWDRRKFRDRMLGFLEPLVTPFVRKAEYAKRPGLTLAIVSRLTPIKQFPLLFQHLVPVLQAAPDVNLEVFGNGGYRSVTDLKQVLAPLGGRVRYWGHQSNVAEIYRNVDYVLSGLPEKEALGLNLIEAQAVGTPVVAVNAPPFTETVKQGVTGWLYRDPREDNGADFAALLQQLRAGAQPDRSRVAAHLELFSEQAFRQRVDLLIQAMAQRLTSQFPPRTAE